MSKFNEYLEAVMLKGPKESIGQKVKDFLNTAIGRLKGWKITFVNAAGVEAPETVPFEAKALRDAKIGDMVLTGPNYEALKAGEIIKPHNIVDIDLEQRIIKLKKDYASTMFMPKDQRKK